MRGVLTGLFSGPEEVDVREEVVRKERSPKKTPAKSSEAVEVESSTSSSSEEDVIMPVRKSVRRAHRKQSKPQPTKNTASPKKTKKPVKKNALARAAPKRSSSK